MMGFITQTRKFHYFLSHVYRFWINALIFVLIINLMYSNFYHFRKDPVLSKIFPIRFYLNYIAE